MEICGAVRQFALRTALSFGKNIASRKGRSVSEKPLRERRLAFGTNQTERQIEIQIVTESRIGIFSSERQPFPTDWHLCIRKSYTLTILKCKNLEILTPKHFGFGH